MRKGFLALIVAATFTSAASAQAWAVKMFGPPETLARDFGTVPHGTQLHHTFVITNIYAVPMSITEIMPGCGCVTWKWNGEFIVPPPAVAKPADYAQCVLKPRQTANIDVYMDAKRFTGPKTVIIRVTVGPNFISTAELRVSAISRADIVCNPGEVKFNPVARGETPSATVDVEYAGQFPWQVTDATTSKEAPFEATVKELYRRPGQVGYQVKVVLKKDAAPGPFRENVFLKTNEPNAALVPVLVEGTVQSPLEVNPPALSLGDVKVGEALTRRVQVTGNKPFLVRGIESPDAVKLNGEQITVANKSQVVTFQVQPTQAGPFRYEIKIKTDLQDAPVPVVIEGVAAP